MRVAFIIVVILASIFGIALPRYLAPNDISGCEVPSTDRCAPADAVVAISGGDTTARANEAIKLYKDGWSKTLIFSGAASDKSGPSNAQAMKTDAMSSGVPATAIVMDEDANTTRENAQNVVAIAKNKGLHRLIVVTSGYHQRRASLEFNKAADGAVQIVNHPVQSDNQWSNWWWATPVGWWLSGSELIKIGAFYTGIG